MNSKLPYNFKKVMKSEIVIDAISDINKNISDKLNYQPLLSSVFNEKIITVEPTNQYEFKIDINAIKQLSNISNNKVQYIISKKRIPFGGENFLNRKRRIGIVFSGGPAPGGHNVISGVFDALKKANNKSSLFGFIMGPDGMIEGNTIEITNKLINKYRNLGGFNMIKTGRTKIDTPNKIELVIKVCKNLKLDSIIIVGGDDSNTNTAFLAQAMFNEKINVIGVPKTIDRDIQVKDINNKDLCSTTFGFHTAATSFANSISNLCVDASSDVKYWHLCKIMGRSASHLALEVAFQAHPNITIIGEELANYVDKNLVKKRNNEINYNAYGLTLNKLIQLICKNIVARAKIGKNYGTIIIPEGLLEFINEIQIYIIKLNAIIANYNSLNKEKFHNQFNSLDKKLKYLNKITFHIKDRKLYPFWNERDNDMFSKIPRLLQEGLLRQRDNHGNFPFSQVKTEKIILNLVTIELKKLQKKGEYSIGIEKKYFKKIFEENKLDEEIYKNILFTTWKSNHLIFKKKIRSYESLTQTLLKAGLLKKGNSPHPSIINLFEKSIPKFKAQTHFYGYDGRGDNPTSFDCTYAYNLGHTAFHLANNQSTGQMASILNLDKNFNEWKPIGIPLAPLMHLEERKNKLTLVLEKTLVDLESPAFQTFKKIRKKWLASDSVNEHYRIVLPEQLTEKMTKPITMIINGVIKNN